MKILLTGSTGMLGSSILRQLEERDFQIYAPKRSELDLLDHESTNSYLDRIEPNFVIHCAAVVGGIKTNIKHPTKFIKDNVLIDGHLFDACIQKRIENFLYISSSCIYPAWNPQPLKINDLFSGQLEPTNKSYAMAKLAGMQLVEAISAEYHFHYRSLVLSNLYGPGDNYDLESSHLLAASIRKTHEAHIGDKQNIEIMGSGRVRREFTYVDDVAVWISKNIENIGSFPTHMNLGYGEDLTVAEYYKLVAKIVGFNGGFTYNLSAPEGMQQKLLDSSIARTEFGWNPTTSHEIGIKNSYESWLKGQPSGEI